MRRLWITLTAAGNRATRAGAKSAPGEPPAGGEPAPARGDGAREASKASRAGGEPRGRRERRSGAQPGTRRRRRKAGLRADGAANQPPGGEGAPKRRRAPAQAGGARQGPPVGGHAAPPERDAWARQQLRVWAVALAGRRPSFPTSAPGSAFRDRRSGAKRGADPGIADKAGSRGGQLRYQQRSRDNSRRANKKVRRN